MATPNQTTATNGSKGKRAKKPPSAARVGAMAAVEAAQKGVDAAKSPQEKTVAEAKLKSARDVLKALKFTEIGAPRIRRAINVMRQLENIANPNAYAWTPEQATKAVNALSAAFDGVKAKLLKVKANKEEFNF